MRIQSQLNRIPNFMSQINLALGDFIPKIATDDEIAANIRSLNKKQRMVFDVLHHWARSYVKNISSKKILRLTQSIYFYLVVET